MGYIRVTSSYYFVFFKNFTPPDKYSLTAPPPSPPRSPTPIPSPLERGVNTLASCWRTGHGDQRPTMISKAHHSPPSLDLWSLARARRGGGSREAARGWGPGWGLYIFLTKKYFFGNVCSTYHSIFAPEIRKEKPS